MYKIKSIYCLCSLLLIVHFTVAQQRPAHSARRDMPRQITVAQQNGIHNTIGLPARRPAAANRNNVANRRVLPHNSAAMSRPTPFTQRTLQTQLGHLANGRAVPPLFIYRAAPAAQTASRFFGTTSCSVDTIILTSQAEIDNFSSNYASCTTPNYLFIDGNNASPAITNLNGLSQLTAVNNKLFISHTAITSLSPLNNISIIGDEMIIEHNPLLQNFGLSNLQTLGSLTLRDLPALTDINGFSNNLSSTGKILMDSVALTNLNGLSGLTQVNGDVEIRHSELTSLSSLNNITDVGYLNLSDNEQLTSLGLSNLTHLSGLIIWNAPLFTTIGPLTAQLTNTDIGSVFFYNTAITDFSGMEHATGFINTFIGGNSNLTSLNGLQNLTQLDYGITIWFNPVLTDISALSGIHHIDNDKLEINGNGALESLNGLGNIGNIGGGLWIENNGALTTLDDLNGNLIIQGNLINDNPDDIENNKLKINYNYQLEACSFAPICNFIENHTSEYIEVHDNATGCSAINEIQANCNNVCTGLAAQTWTGANGSNWSDPDNWAPTGVPGTCTKVTIPSQYDVPTYPIATENINIGGLIMQNDAVLNMDNHSLHLKDTLWMEYANIWYGENIIANNVMDPHVISSYIEGNFSLQNYTGTHQFWFNTVYGNTELSDNPARTDYSSTFLNEFYGDLNFINNSDAGNMYLSNASAGGSNYDFVQGNLTVINNSSADISVGLGDDRPIKVQGDININASNGRIDIHNLTLVGGTFNPGLRQVGSNPIEIDNLYLESNAETRLDHEVFINNSLVFDNFSNKINTTQSNLLTLKYGATVSRDPANTRGFVNGPMKKIGAEGFTFPVGKYEFDYGGDNYGPISISAPASISDEFIAEYFHHSPGADGYDTSLHEPGFGGISAKEYWMLQRAGGTSTVQVSLSYDSTRSGVAYQYDLIQVAGWNGSLWKSWSSGGYTGNIQSGSVISATALSDYGPLTLSFKPVRKPIISINPMDSARCLNTAFYVHYTADTLMTAGNQMRIEISDTLGNFSQVWNPTFGTKYTSAAEDSILFYSTALLPNKDYKIRLVGNLPPDTSINTQTIRFITAPQNSVTVSGSAQVCLGSGVYKYYPSFTEPGVTYSWALNAGGTFTTNGDTAIVNWTATGIYSLQLTVMNSCGQIVRGIFTEVKPPAPTATPDIFNIGRWLYSSQAPANAGYQWYRNGAIISGANNASYYAALAGDYTQRFTNTCGAGPASDTISFAANSLAQTINFAAIADKVYNDAPFVPTVSASSGLPVLLTVVNGPATINSITNMVTITGTGVVTVRATQPGNDVYDTAAPVLRSFTVNKASQTITFTAIPNQDISNGSVVLSAVATSSLSVSFTVVSGPATLSGNTLTLTGIGNVTISASQPGNENYLPAGNVSNSFCISVANLGTISGFNNLCPGTTTYSVNNIAGATYSWRIAGGAVLPSTTHTANVNWVTPGVYSLIVSAGGNCGVPSNNDTLQVTVISSIQPDSVQSMLPANNAINQQLPLTLSWVPAHPNNFYTFDLYVWRADQSQPSTPYVAGLTSVNYTLPVSSGLLPAVPYKWMVVAHNGSCTPVQTGPVQQFTLIPLPDLQVQNIQVPATAFSGQTIAINWTVKNNGPGNTTTNQNWTDAVFLSFDSHPNFSIAPGTNPGAWSQLDFPVRPLLIATKPNVSALNSGEQYSNSVNFTLPLSYSQPLYVYVITNYPVGANAPQQINVLNDTASAPQPIAVSLSPTPDLRVDTVFVPNTTFSGSNIHVTYKVKNYGVLTPAGASWTDKIYISESAVFNINTAIPVKLPKANGTYYSNAIDATLMNNTQLQADSAYTRSVEITVPNFIFGSYFIHVFTNATASVYEGALQNNNTNSGQLQQVFLTPTPHLTVSSLNVPVTIASTTQPIGVNWNILNTGINDNIEKNKGHYYVYNGSCVMPNTAVAGINFRDSAGFGSSYWVDKVYLSADGSSLNTSNAILVSETAQGILNSGLNVPDNYSNPAAEPCMPAGTNGSVLNLNTDNVIRPSSNHPKSAAFTIPANLAAGNYYVYVLANANRTVFENPGQPETMRSALPITIQRPDAVVSSVTVPANATGAESITIHYNIVNNGPGTVFNQLRNDKIYVSNAAVFDASAQLITTLSYTENLPVGTPVSHSFNYTFAPSASGTKYFYVHTNFDSSFKETNANNNISAAAATVVSAAATNDMQVAWVQLADTVPAIFSANIKYKVSNAGSHTITGTWKDSVFISCSPVFNSATAYYIAHRTHSEVLPAAGSYTDSFYVNIPYTFTINNCFPQNVYTTAYYFVKTNADNMVYEGSNANNNITGSGSRITFNPMVDHVVTQVSGPDTATVARPYLTAWTVKNNGYNPGSTNYANWYDAVYFSTDSVWNGNAVLSSYFVENNILNNNQSYLESRQVTTPNISTGDYYVFAVSNAFNNIPGEKVWNNNYNLIRNGLGVAKKIHVIQPLLPDLTDSIVAAPASIPIGQPITITHRVMNNGAGVTYPANWSGNIWLSSDFIPGNAGDILLAAKNHTGALQPGDWYNDTVTANISLNITPGNYILISRVNAGSNVFESNLSNNLAFSYISVYRPAPADLMITSVTHPDTVYLGYAMDMAKWVIKNNAVNAATGVSSDGIYLSQSTVLDSTAILLGIKNKTINMGPLATDTISLAPLVTDVTEGSYNILVKTDLLNNIYESDKTNNSGISATPVYVSVQELPMETLTANTLFTTSRFYKLIIPDSLDGATILVSLRSNDSLSMKNQLFIGKGYVPSAAAFDYTYSTPNYGNQDIVMTSVTTGVYYISIRCVSASPVLQDITLKATRLPFAILAVQSNSGGNIGNVTVQISGSLFTNNMTATLTKPGTIITASSVYYSNSTTVFATFNLQGKPLGIYNVALTKPDAAEAELANAFSIVNANNGGGNNGNGNNTGQSGSGNEPGCDPGTPGGLNSLLVTEIVAPDKVFVGWPFVIQINYTNPANFDIPAQTRTLFNDKQVKTAFTQAGLANGTNALHLQLTEPGGPPGIIRAGASGSIIVYGQMPADIPGHTHVHFTLQ